jgi:hypothetical protein
MNERRGGRTDGTSSEKRTDVPTLGACLPPRCGASDPIPERSAASMWRPSCIALSCDGSRSTSAISRCAGTFCGCVRQFDFHQHHESWQRGQSLDGPMPGCGHGDSLFIWAVRWLGHHFSCRGPRVHMERDVAGRLGRHHVGGRGSGGRHHRVQCGGQRRSGFATGGGCRKRSAGDGAAGAGALPLRRGAYRRTPRSGRRRAEHRGQDAPGVCLDGSERSAVGQRAARIGAWPGDCAGHRATEPG